MAQVGRGGSQTFGSSIIRFGRNRQVVERRIDLLFDDLGKLSALPHELTHVVLADRFGGRQPPPWADEGIATLSDPKEKRALHHRDCCHAIDSGTALRLIDLLTLSRLSHPGQRAAFYGQSVSLAKFLAEQDTSTQLIDFVELAMQTSYDQALRDCYDIQGVAELERLWRAYVRDTHQPAVVADVSDQLASFRQSARN